MQWLILTAGTKGLHSFNGISSVAGGSDRGIVLRLCPFRCGGPGAGGILVYVLVYSSAPCTPLPPKITLLKEQRGRRS